MKIARVVASVLIILSANTAFGYEEERALNNQAHELVECAVYYDILEEGSKRAGKEESANASKAASRRALDLARVKSRDDVVLARYKLAFEDLIKTIDGNYKNLTVLIVKYGDSCKQAVENPNERLNYWKNMK